MIYIKIYICDKCETEYTYPGALNSCSICEKPDLCGDCLECLPAELCEIRYSYSWDDETIYKYYCQDCYQYVSNIIDEFHKLQKLYDDSITQMKKQIQDIENEHKRVSKSV